LQNSTAPFAETAAFWAEKTTCSAVSLWIGICTYKLGQEDPWAGDGQMEWQTDFHIPSEEISVLLSMEQIDGIAIYDYATTFEPEDTTIQRAMETERDIISQLFLS
jgi:hypothetical protein